MMERALVVERARGEEARRALVAAGALRTDLEIRDEGDWLAFPVRADAGLPIGWGTVETREFAARAAVARSEFRDLLDWPAAEKGLVPRAFDVVGDIVLVRIPPELEDRKFEVGEALLRFVPGSRLVGLDRGVTGPERRRQVERIAGAGGWRTRHRENRLELDVDVERAYFSPRLAREHALVAAEVRPGERVYDLCCGVGPFAISIARDGRAREVVAVDANPTAVELMDATLARYRFATPVRTVASTVEAFARTAPPVERVVMNLPREGIKYAPLVAPLVAPEGTLHFYEVVPRDEVAGRGPVVERALAAFGGLEVRSVRVVHPYSPASDLVSVTVARRAA